LGSNTRDIQTPVFPKKKDNWEVIKRISIDEVSQRKGHGDFVTVVSNIDLGELLEVIDSHKQEEIITIFKQQPLEIREKVEEVSVDMWGGFPKVVKEVFPNAKIVIDRFHVMQPVIKELNPHSARNGRIKTITKQEQGANNSVGRREKRNSKCEGEEETNLQLESGSEKKLNEPP
jgi:transposase